MRRGLCFAALVIRGLGLQPEELYDGGGAVKGKRRVSVSEWAMVEREPWNVSWAGVRCMIIGLLQNKRSAFLASFLL